MKAIFISFNQAFEELVIRVLSHHNVNGYTLWSELKGKGSRGGEPHMGSHAWPTLNGAILVISPSSQVDPILAELKALDEATPAQGLRAFVWDVEKTI